MDKKGITRKLRKTGKKLIQWDYFDHRGKIIRNAAVRDRCNRLVLPPAWKDVWISPDRDADLQATGKDARGRLQYRYHENWTKARASEKFDGLTRFARLLPVIRKNIDADLKRKGMPKAKVVALMVRLIDLYHFRIGNDEYARSNESYGLATIREGHVTFDRSKNAEGELDAVFEFIGKSGKLWKRRIWEDDLARLIDASGAVGGRHKTQDLFRYEDENGQDFDIKAHHINEYLDAITPKNCRVTAKDFRTWAASWKMASRLAEQHDPDTVPARKRVINLVLKTVSSDLGNTVAVCRSSYVHPVILSDWENGVFRKKWNKALHARKMKGLSKEETTTLFYLQ